MIGQLLLVPSVNYWPTSSVSVVFVLKLTHSQFAIIIFMLNSLLIRLPSWIMHEFFNPLIIEIKTYYCMHFVFINLIFIALGGEAFCVY